MVKKKKGKIDLTSLLTRKFLQFLVGLRPSYICDTFDSKDFQTYQECILCLRGTFSIYRRRKMYVRGYKLGSKEVLFLCNDKSRFKHLKSGSAEEDAIGGFLGIPRCCIKAYEVDFVEECKKREEEKIKYILSGLPATERFERQIKRIKNKRKRDRLRKIYDVYHSGSSINYRFFIPCSPECSKAFVICKSIYDWEERLGDLISSFKIKR